MTLIAAMPCSKEQQQVEVLDVEAQSASKLTVTTDPLSLPTSDPTNVPRSNSTLSSSASLEMLNKALMATNVNEEEEEEEEVITPPTAEQDSTADLPSTCSSPYQAFLFSSEWLGSSEHLQLLSRSSSQGAAGNNNNNNNDETDSVVSGGYFEPVDLDSSNWMKAIRMDGPTFGFAMIAVATALVHPVLFVAGALAAFGTLKGYEYCSGVDGKSSAAASAASWEQCMLSLCHKELAEEDPTLQLDKAMELPSLPQQQHDEEDNSTNHANNSILLSAPPLGEVTNTSTTTTTTKPTAGAFPTVDEETALLPERSRSETTSRAPPRQLGKKSSPRQPISTVLVEQAYPNLDTMVVEGVSFPGLHAIEFFDVFFADDAPYNFMELQKQRGDLDIVYGQWHQLGPSDPIALHDGDSNAKAKGPTKQQRLTSNALQTQALSTLLTTESTKTRFQGRVLTFKAKTNNFIGPVYATTRKTQRVLLYHKTCIVMESRTDLSDIPFCDRFYVLERWIIRAQKLKDETGNAKYKYVSTLEATSQVVFTGSCQFASQIKSKSASTIQELSLCWCTMAKEALKLTEQRKKLRLKHEQEGESDFDYYDETDQEDDSVNPSSHNNHNTAEDGDEDGENVPPPEGEGIEVTWPKPEDNTEQKDRPTLRHSDSAPLPLPKKYKLQAFKLKRSFSSLWNKRQ